MKTKLIFLLLLASFAASAQIVNIPDVIFKNALLENNSTTVVAKDINGALMIIDSNDDNEIQMSEAQLVYSLEITNLPITSIVGISSFVNLQALKITTHQLTAADVSGMSSLKVFHCNDGPTTSINVSGCINLEHAWFSELQVSSLNFSGLQNLKKIECENDLLLNSINVSECTSLEILDTDMSKLAALDVSGLSNLKEIHCNNNEISSINLSGCIMLSQLQLWENNLTTISLSGLGSLRSLEIGDNLLTALNLEGLNLEYLSLDSNQITTLDLSDQINLKVLTIDSNPISTIDLSASILLEQLVSSNTLLTTLDLSSNPLIWELDANNTSIQYINLKSGGTNFIADTIESSNLSSMPNLLFICADEEEIPLLQLLATQSGTNVNITTYCSFTPGGNYNTITGTTIFDIDNNGCGTGSDVFEGLMKVKIDDGTTTGYTFTNNLSQYKFYTQAGNFTLTPEFENNWFTANPATATVNFANNNNNISTNNFCITSVGSHPDVEVVVYPIGNAQPGFDATYKLVYRNKGNQVLSGGFSFNYDESVLDFVSAIPAAGLALPGQLQYAYTNLLPFEDREIIIQLNLNGPMETPPLNNGDDLEFFAEISTDTAGDETPGDNTHIIHQEIVGSYDPNDIICLEGNMASPAQIGEYLHYVVNFENTGTAPTSFIVVRIDVNPAQYDIASLRVLNTSHASDIRVTGNRIEFIMPTAVLAAGDHGNILFKMKTKASLVEGNMVKKKANIYFDYNFPIVTNEANTTFQALSTGSWAKDDSVKVYPNPSEGVVKIEASSAINSIELYDVQGRLLEVQKAGEVSTSLDITNRAKGIYFIKVVTGQGAKVEKIVRK